ncbi:MAG: hypothetical protein B7X83_05035 [Polynucleobacter sp. 17-46-58]|nr:MAG: hypothetical protein B7X83_05035 [Polynucleobacter sp. 17-46-58]HQS60873.1 helix-turn-helix domain-containing protein [Polynucleobacter sp.]HQT20068.1 helix-turn-helix domain-containing protein [Polynucleobacter sp.]HQT42068.1 helix-turn-helix domain-containing protein [Polynucleobacter sp.]
MTSNSKLPEINKAAFAQAREKLGLSAKDLGGMACLSTRQIEQIENGESATFYSAQVKFTAAKKVAKLLGLSEKEAFEFDEKTAPKEVEPEPTAITQEVQAPINPVKESTPKQKTESANPEQDLSPLNEAPKEVVSSIDSSESKPAKKKNLFLWLSVLAAAAFAIINLSSFFFADNPQEVVIVKEEVITVPQTPSPTPSESAPAPSTPATLPVTPAVPATVPAPSPVIASELSTACPAEEAIIRFKPEAPRKAGDMVYLQAKSKQVVCVVDASGKTQNKLLEPGVGASFYGQPPFKVLTSGLREVDVFFQGTKVRLADPAGKTLILEATGLVKPSVDPTDSQFR